MVNKTSIKLTGKSFAAKENTVRFFVQTSGRAKARSHWGDAMKIKSLLLAAVATATIGTSGLQAASYVYVGSWEVYQGPSWGTQPLSYTGQAAAALLFGGSASDYVTSTAGSSTSNINFKAWYSVLGGYGPNNGGFEFAQDYVSPGSTQAPGYYYSGSPFTFDGTDAASAYVADNAGSDNVNYAFRLQGSVPEPASWALMLGGFGAIGGAMRSRRKAAVSFG